MVNVNDDVFLYQAAVENRDDLHASEEDLALVGQDVEDGQELPNSQQQEEELHELSSSTVVQTGGQGVEESRVEASSCSCTCSREEKGQWRPPPQAQYKTS